VWRCGSTKIIFEAHAALSRSSYSKLLFVGDPGVLVSPAFAKESPRGLQTAVSYILFQALITFRRIILKPSVPTLNNG
jgi:hypothetical protein